MRKLMNFKTLIVLIFLGFVTYQAHQLFQFEITPIFSFIVINVFDVLMFFSILFGYVVLLILFYILAIHFLLIKHYVRYFTIKEDVIYLFISFRDTSYKTVKHYVASPFDKLHIMRC